MEYKEIEDDGRVYIVPVGIAFVPTRRQPKPNEVSRPCFSQTRGAFYGTDIITFPELGG